MSSRGNRSGAPEYDELGDFVANDLRLPAAATAGPGPVPPSSESKASAVESNWPISTEEVLPEFAPAKPGPIGNPAAVSLDPRAPFLPNSAAGPALIDNYRRLRTKLLQQIKAQQIRTIVITSAVPQEGKTVTAINLALSFAMLPSFNVLLVDGDLRRGRIGHLFGNLQHPGLGDLLQGSVRLEDVVFKSEQGIYFMTCGASRIAPGELLQTDRLGSHFQRMAERFDLVLIDSPPANLVADPHLMAASADAVLLVARAFVTTRKALEKVVQDLYPSRILGAVLNGGTPARIYGGYRGYGYYSKK
jgi:capsular exopolysaccharide synthesis family protein